MQFPSNDDITRAPTSVSETYCLMAWLSDVIVATKGVFIQLVNKTKSVKVAWLLLELTTRKTQYFFWTLNLPFLGFPTWFILKQLPKNAEFSGPNLLGFLPVYVPL